MNTRKKISILAAVILFISSCSVLSFHPLYTEDVLVTNDQLLGKWMSVEEKSFNSNDDDTLVWEIRFNEEKWVKKPSNPFDKGSKQMPNTHTYTLAIYEKDQPELQNLFDLHLVELEGQLYLDFFPDEWDGNNTIMDFHLIGVHTFAKTQINADSISIQWFDSEWFEEKLEQNQIRIKHEKNSANILLTAQPKDLQKFVIKYGKDPKAFEEAYQIVLKPFKE
jgi:hypothetical protein